MDEKESIIYKKLTEVARKRGLTNYTEVGRLIGLDMATEVGRIRIAQILDNINRYEVAQNRPMVSALVIRQDINMPGTGFFECARGLSKYHGQNDMEFWVKEVNKVHNYWSQENKES